MSYLNALCLEHQAKKARKDGRTADVVLRQKNPVFKMRPCLGNTMEGCVLGNLPRDIYAAVRAEFDRLPHEVRHQQQYIPANAMNEWKARAVFWVALLERSLNPEQCHIAGQALASHYMKVLASRNLYPEEKTA